MNKTLIRGGLIYDGSLNPPKVGNVLIVNAKIAAVGRTVCEEEAAAGTAAMEVIDAGGLTVTPGFIDIHRHCELDALCNSDFGRIELRQGITSVIGGSCGLGIFPMSSEYGIQMYDFIEPCLGTAPQEYRDRVRLGSYARYMEVLRRKGVPLHMGCLQGTGAVKAAIKGYARSPFTHKELQRAKDYITQALAAGAPGLSMGVMYQPECYSSRDEMVELLRTASAYGRPLTCHIRGEGNTLTASVAEMLDICRTVQIPLHISHLKATGTANWGRKIHEALELIETARAQGQDVTADFYPYCGGATTLSSLLPDTVMRGSMQETFEWLNTAAGRDLLKRELDREHEGWDNMVTAIGWERISISSVSSRENSDLSGMNMLSAAERRGYDHPADLVADLLYREKGKVGIILFSMAREDVDTIAKLPYTMLISDALYGSGDCPHPRLYGSFPQFLQEYAVDRKIVSFEEAVHKMTQLPAQRLSLKGRGEIKQGNYADIAVLGREGLTAHATFAGPRQLCTGLEYLFVDGNKMVVRDEMCLDKAAGVLECIHL